MALEIQKNTLGEEHPDYANSLVLLSNNYNKLGNYTEAINLGTLAAGIIKKVLSEEHPQYANSLNNLTLCYFEFGNYSEAMRLGHQAMEINKKVVGEENLTYAISLNDLAIYYSALGKYTEAIGFGNQALEIRKKIYGEKHPSYATTLSILAYTNLSAGNFSEASKQFSKYYNLANSFVLDNFSTMTNKERSNYWKDYSNFFINILPYATFKCTKTELCSLAYNGQLFAKGLNLNAEIEFQNLIEKSGDKLIIKRYNNIRNNRAILDKLYQVPIDKRAINTDSLQAVIEKQEKELVALSKELGDYTRNLSITWRDVQNNLKSKDMAIEFASFYDEGVETYMALVLKPAMENPQIVKLFTKNELNDIYLSAYYKTTKITDLVWKPLQQYLNGVENVYFAPTGVLHTIGIEYLPTDNGNIFASKYNAYRLSSTRELALPKTDNKKLLAAVYGGVVYDFSKDNWEDLRKHKDKLVAEFRDMPDYSCENMRAELTFLTGAKVEAETISKILHNSKYQVLECRDVYATEESFKKLSGSGLKLLHIATHGFYEPENKKKPKQSDMLSSTDKISIEDRSLSRSGLFLAGAASALDPEKRKEIPDGIDDGILTAKEISLLDFKGLDLVVLSACKTGLGDITSDGVFGLQRGFKKAGAQTIVMSLWNVSDEATKDLMTEFYKNLVAGQSKRSAFIVAQEKLRQKYPDPKKWAAFIMVDGLEN